jgi:hypothetical protein
MMTHKISDLREVLRDNRAQLHARANVVATGIGYKLTGGEKTSTLSIICSVAQKLPVAQLQSKDLVPKTLDGVPIDVIQTGPIRALQSHTDRIRPAPGGVSIGHRDITAGTFGCVVKRNNQAFILSNNHVLANTNAAELGDPILQPGVYDGGRYPPDHIANLEQFVPIYFPGDSSDCSTAQGISGILNAIAQTLGSDTRLHAVKEQVPENLVDAAIAKPLNPDDIREEILEIGTVKGIVQGQLGMAVTKSGRTTGLTSGKIEQVDVSANVQYGQNQTAYFIDQLMAGAMSQGGDSGSAILDDNNNLVGLLFAGSENSTIINRIENVFSALKVSL